MHNVRSHRYIWCCAQCWGVAAFAVVHSVGDVGTFDTVHSVWVIVIFSMVHNGSRQEFTHNVKYLTCRTCDLGGNCLCRTMRKDNFQKTFPVSKCEAASLYIPYSRCRADKQNQTKWHPQHKVCFLLFCQYELCIHVKIFSVCVQYFSLKMLPSCYPGHNTDEDIP